MAPIRFGENFIMLLRAGTVFILFILGYIFYGILWIFRYVQSWLKKTHS